MKNDNQTKNISNNGIIIIGEKQKGQILPVTKELIKAGQILAARSGQPISVLISSGANPFLTEKVLLPVLKKEKPSLVLFGSTAFGRILGSVLSASLDTEIIMDAAALRYDSNTDRFIITKSSPDGRHLADYATASVKKDKESQPVLVSVRQGVLSGSSSSDICLPGCSSPDTCLPAALRPAALPLTVLLRL